MVVSPFATARSGSWRRVRWALAAACAVSGLWACRLGGAASSDPILDPPPLGDERADAGQSGQSGDDSPPQGEAGSSSPPPPDAGETSGADAASLPGTDAAVGGEPDARAPEPDADDAGSCGQTIAGCDPIRKTGCVVEFQMQCDVDLLAPTPTGVCVFNAPSSDPNTCLNIPPTESCPAGQTCVDAKCHTICLCDSECESGKCCNKPVGLGGFKVCAEC
jgi:hypothetical protein